RESLFTGTTSARELGCEPRGGLCKGSVALAERTKGVLRLREESEEIPDLSVGGFVIRWRIAHELLGRGGRSARCFGSRTQRERASVVGEAHENVIGRDIKSERAGAAPRRTHQRASFIEPGAQQAHGELCPPSRISRWFRSGIAYHLAPAVETT